MIYNFEELQAVKNKSNIYFLFGEEDFFIFRSYRKLIEELKFEVNFAIEIYDCEEIGNEDNIGNFLENIFSLGLFGEKKLIVLKSIEKLFQGKTKKGVEESLINKFRKLISNSSKDLYLVFISFDSSLYGLKRKLNSIKNNTDKVKFLSSQRFPFDILLELGVCFEFPKIYQSQYRFELRRFFKEAGYEIDEPALDLIVSQTELNLWALYSEFQKVTIFLKDKKKISLFDVRQIISAGRTKSVFNLITNVAKRNLSEALETMQSILSTSRQEILVTNQLLKYFRNLLVVIDFVQTNHTKEQIAREIGISPYFFDDYAQGAKNYSKTEIQKTIEDIINVDNSLKTSSVNPLYLFTELLIKIIGRDYSKKI